MVEENEDVRATYGIDWVKTAGGALAAVTAAVLLSTLGAAGTLLGAAVGSIAATVGTSLYSQGLERSRRAASAVQTTALSKVSVAQTEVLRAVRRDDEGDHEAATAHLEHAEETLAEAKAGLEGDPEEGEPGSAVDGEDAAADGDEAAADASSGSLVGRLKELGWKRLALAAGATFVLVMVVLTGFELVAGKSVSQLTGGSTGDGGTSFTDFGGGSGSGNDEPSQGPGDQQTGPTDDATTDSPSDGSTDESDDPSDGTTEDTDEPTDEPTSPGTTAPTSSATR